MKAVGRGGRREGKKERRKLLQVYKDRKVGAKLSGQRDTKYLYCWPVKKKGWCGVGITHHRGFFLKD